MSLPSTTRRTRSSTRTASPTNADAEHSAGTRHVSLQHRASPVDEASSSTAPNNTGEAVQSILKARKCWRSIKGKEEAVWPPELEAALIEGLERYKPAESKSTRVLGRFPMRNKFVADFIFETTDVRRTPKQVGSRIQQLRDTNSGKHILKAISDRHYAMMHPKRRDAQEQSDLASRSTSFKAAERAPRSPSPSMSHVYIQTLPPNASWQSHPLASCSSGRADLHSQDPRPLHMIDPTVTFHSPGRSACHSSFRVFKDGRLVHEETTQVIVSSTPQPGLDGLQTYLYSTSLVPNYWAQLCAAEDPASYTIQQEVIRIPFSAPPSQDTPPDVLLSVYYHFVDGSSFTPPLSPHSSCDSEVDYVQYHSPLLTPLADDTGMFGLGLQDAVDQSVVPGLIQPYEDGYTSQPGSPMEYPPIGISQWGYPATTVLSPDLSVACDSYFDPSVMYSPHGF